MRPATSPLRTAGRWLLAALLLFAGIGHFADTDSFLAQVPPWLPWRTAIIYASGVIEIAFAVALVAAGRWLAAVGVALAAFFVVVFPGNISQAITGTPAFGLDTTAARWVRLLFQPLLVVWALWATGAWRRRHEFRSWLSGRWPPSRSGRAP